MGGPSAGRRTCASA